VKNYLVRRYEPADYAAWNAFVSSAKNATFLFHRDFMEYHADRFPDFSMLVFDGENVVSVIPANRVENKIYSHQGLTYGGFVFSEKIKMGQAIDVVHAVLKYLHDQQLESILVKSIPGIYNRYFSEEVSYAFFLTDAKLERRDCLAVLDLEKPFKISKTRQESIRRGEKNRLEIREELQFDLFWNTILIPNLDKKHNAKPVHTAAEIAKLQKSFPENIRHFNVYNDGEIVAGTTIFIADQVAHPQYISGNSQKNELGSIDYLYHYLITDVFKDKKFFDFGPSHENNGRKINEGILFWKESFGAKITVQDFYELQTKNYTQLENILI